MAQPSGKVSYLDGFPDLQQKLQHNGSRAALLAGNFAGDAIDLAKLYPDIHIDLFVPHQSCMEAIQGDLISADLEGRVTVHHLRLDALDDMAFPAVSYDIIRIGEDISAHPDGLLKVAKALAGQTATVLLEIPNLSENFTGDPTNIAESYNYGHSLTLGLPENKVYRNATENWLHHSTQPY